MVKVIEIIWFLIFVVLSLFILVGCLWLLRVITEWWLNIDYVKEIREWLKK